MTLRRSSDAEERHDRARSNLALLVRLAQAEKLTDRGGTSPELEHDAWHAIYVLLWQAYQDVGGIYSELRDLQVAPKGGAR